MFTTAMLAGLALASISGLTACSSDSESGGPTCVFTELVAVDDNAVTGTWCVDLNLDPEFPETCTAQLGQQPFESMAASDWEVSVNANAVSVSVDGADQLLGTASGLEMKLTGLLTSSDPAGEFDVSCAEVAVFVRPTGDSFVGTASFAFSTPEPGDPGAPAGPACTGVFAVSATKGSCTPPVP